MHTLITGTTGSGKTTLCIKLSQIYALKGIESIILDPFKNPDFEGDIYNDKAEFLEAVFTSASKSIFVDEGGQTIGRDMDMIRIATQGRHYGHTCNFICHRYSDVSKTLRAMCSNLFIFCGGRGDVKILKDEFVHIDNEYIEQIPYLKRGECLLIPRFGRIKKINTFDLKIF